MRWRAFDALRRRVWLQRLADPHFAFMVEPAPAGEWVSIDCETTGLDVRRDKIIAIGAVRIVGNRLLTSQRLELLVQPDRALTGDSVRVHRLRERDLEAGLAPDAAIRQLLEFIGSRPLVGYYLEFDVALINRAMRPLLGVGLPQPLFEVSAMYYDHKNRALPAHRRGGDIDLRLATLLDDLGLPRRDAHDAINDAVMAGLAFVKLRRLLGRPG